MTTLPLVIQRQPWCAEAEQGLQRAAGGDMAWIRAEVLAGVAVLWRISGQSTGWLVTRQEPEELVIVLGEGRNSRPVIRHLMQVADAAGLPVRVHLKDWRLVALYRRLGFVEREKVLGYGR